MHIIILIFIFQYEEFIKNFLTIFVFQVDIIAWRMYPKKVI